MLNTTLIGNKRKSCAIPAMALIVAACSLAAPRESRGAVIWKSGHGDIGVAYENAQLELHYHFHGGATFEDGTVVGPAGDEYEPGDVYTRVADPPFNRPDGSQWDILGAAAGSPIWFLPQSQDVNKPYVGIASEELGDEWSNITWALTDFTGPTGGNFSLFQLDPFGNIDPKTWDTQDGSFANDQFELPAGGHDHFNFGFTQPGVYTVTITASGTHRDDGFQSDTADFTFLVGSNTAPPNAAVPEPSTVLLCALAAVGGFPWWLRQRRRERPQGCAA